MITYDHRNQSIHIAYTFDELLHASQAGDPFNLWAAFGASTEDQIKYRHEHAHFVSYNATGLAEFHAVFLDYRLFLLAMATKHLISKRGAVFPLLLEEAQDIEAKTIRRAISQVLSQEAFLFGYGSSKSIADLFAWEIQQEALEILSTPLLNLNPNVLRYRSVVRQILFTTSPAIVHLADGGSIYLGDANSRLRLSSRAVMEGYAVTIEVVSEHIKHVRTSLDVQRAQPKRLPGALDRAAIDFFLDLLPDREIAPESFANGNAGADVYWAASLMMFAALQVPVLEDLSGLTIVMGSLKQLSPAHRLASIARGIEKGQIDHPLATYNQRENAEAVLDWLNRCHEYIGDPWSIKFYQYTQEMVVTHGIGMDALKRSSHALSKLARASFLDQPYHVVSEAGILTQISPRYIRTADNRLVSRLSSDEREAFVLYVFDTAVHIFEAILDAESWSTSWEKAALYGPEERKSAILIACKRYCDAEISEMRFANGFS